MNPVSPLGEFPLIPLEEVAELKGGYAFKSTDYKDKGAFVLRTLNIGADGSITRDNAVFIDENRVPEFERFNLVEWDTVFVMVGATLGKTGLVRPGDLPALLNQNMWVIRAKRSLMDPGFLHYMFAFQSKTLLGWASGAARDFVRRDDFRKLMMPSPPLAEQRAIAGVLGALDDKIESNRRTWKISTDLVRTEYACLIPAESESTCRLSDICDFNVGTLKPGKPGEAIRYIDISCVEAGVVTGEIEALWADAPSRARRPVSDGDVIFSTVRPARMAYSVMFKPHRSTVVSTGFAVMKPKGVPSTLLFAIVSDSDFGKYCDSVSQGSAYPAVSPDAMGNYEVKCVRMDALAIFGEKTELVLRRAHQGLQENRALSRLREVLLPELLSGRLRVKDAESMMESV